MCGTLLNKAYSNSVEEHEKQSKVDPQFNSTFWDKRIAILKLKLIKLIKRV